MTFEPGDDLTALALDAVRAGAEVLGMAGGDGSQAAVAAVAAEHALPFVCVPAGTRNHFASDLGIDRDDIVGALDAFVDGEERRIDLGSVNGRVFVNNVAMGIYGAVVQSPEYRAHKARTFIGKLPELIGPRAEPFDLRFTGRDGRSQGSALLVLVSNNPYSIDLRPDRGTRGRLDQGLLGLIAVTAGPPPQVQEWAEPAFRVDSGGAVAVGIDGESVTMAAPLEFESDRQALRVLLPVGGRRRSPRPHRDRMSAGSVPTGD